MSETKKEQKEVKKHMLDDTMIILYLRIPRSGKEQIDPNIIWLPSVTKYFVPTLRTKVDQLTRTETISYVTGGRPLARDKRVNKPLS